MLRLMLHPPPLQRLPLGPRERAVLTALIPHRQEQLDERRGEHLGTCGLLDPVRAVIERKDALRRAALARDAYARKYQPRSRLNFPDQQVSLSEVETMRVPGNHQEPAYVRIDAWLAEQ